MRGGKKKSTGPYVDYNLANKVPTTGDATISGTLTVQRLSITNTSARPIEINNTMHNGPYLVAISQNHSSNDLLFALRCLPLNQLWCFGVATSNQYIISHENSTKLSIQPNGNATISGNLDVSKVSNLQRHPTESDTIPLVITTTSSSGAGFMGKCVPTVKVCLFNCITNASSSSWWQGVVSGLNEFVIKTGSKGLTIKSNGSAVLSGSLTQFRCFLKG